MPTFPTKGAIIPFFRKDYRLIDTPDVFDESIPLFTASALCLSDSPSPNGWQPYYTIVWEVSDTYITYEDGDYRVMDFYKDDLPYIADWTHPVEINKNGYAYNVIFDSFFADPSKYPYDLPDDSASSPVTKTNLGGWYDTDCY